MFVNTSRRDSNEEIWSRGSLIESSDYSSPVNLMNFDNDGIKGKIQLFRYEQGGTLVYLSNARIAGELPRTDTCPILTESPGSKKVNQKLLENVRADGKF